MAIRDTVTKYIRGFLYIVTTIAVLYGVFYVFDLASDFAGVPSLLDILSVTWTVGSTVLSFAFSGLGLTTLVLALFTKKGRRYILPKLPWFLGGDWFRKKYGVQKKFWQWQKIKTYGIAPFKLWMRKSPNRFIKWFLLKYPALTRDPYVPGTLPYVFRQLRTEFMILMNWQTRLHTYFGKRDKVEESKNRAVGIEANFGGTQKTFDELTYVLDNHRFGGDYGWSNNLKLIEKFFEMLKENLEGNLTLKSERHGAEQDYYKPLEDMFNKRLIDMGGKYQQFTDDLWKFALVHRLRSIKLHILDLVTLYGACKHYYRFANENAVFELWKCPKNAIDKSNPVIWSVDWEKLTLDKTEQCYIDYVNARKAVKAEIFKEKLRQKEKELERIFTSQIIRNRPEDMRHNPLSLADVQKIMQQIQQELPNRQKEIDYEVEAELTTKGASERTNNQVSNIWKVGWGGQVSSKGKIYNLRHEVDIRGFFLEDVHAIEVDHKSTKYPGYIRRVRVVDIEDLPAPYGNTFNNWTSVYSWILQEWDYFLPDLRFGEYHPLSRSHRDYTGIMEQQRSLDFSNLSTTKPNASAKLGAFDFEALAYSGKWVYWGRKKYWDAGLASGPDSEVNPYPTLSTVGLSRVITEIIKLKAGENEITDKFLSYWVWDNTKPEDIFSTLLGKEGT